MSRYEKTVYDDCIVFKSQEHDLNDVIIIEHVCSGGTVIWLTGRTDETGGVQEVEPCSEERLQEVFKQLGDA